MNLELQGKTALVTGATSGIGRAIAINLADLGADVLVHGRDAKRADEVMKTIEARGGTGRFVAADLSVADDVRRLAASAGDVHVLVNNAGIFRFGSTADTDDASFDAHIDTNLRAPFLLVQALAPDMAARGWGAIVNISSGAATTPGRGTGIYGASKVALELLTRIWADEFGPAGVRVNAVAAGPTRTMGTEAFGDAALAQMGKMLTIGRVAEPAEIAQVVVFLVTARSSFINGAVLPALGGIPALGG